MKRRFKDAPQELRCKATITLKDGSEAQCGRYAKVNGLCKQHHEMQGREQKRTYRVIGHDDEFKDKGW